MANLNSPFVSAVTAKRLPALVVGSGKLVVRVGNEGAESDKVYFLNDRSLDASSTRADGFLMAGESVEIEGRNLASEKADSITIIAASGTPNIYFGVM